MAKTVRIILEVDDKGSAKVVQISNKLESEAKKAAMASQKAFQQFERQAQASLNRTFKRVARWGAMIATVLVLGAGAAMIKTGAQFEQSMANINAILRPTAIEMENLTGKARELGRTTVFSSAQAADAMQKLSLAGFKTSEILGVMDDTLALAAAGELDMAEAARITANVMRGLSIPVSKFKSAVNALTFAATNSNQTISDMGHAFKFIGPVANAINADITELSAALAVLANVGLRGEMAGTGLRRSLTVFLGEIPDGTEGISKMNLQLEVGADKTFSLAKAIDRMTEKGITASEVMKAFGQRAGPAMLAMMNAGSAAIRKYQLQIEELGVAKESLAATIARMKLDTTIGDFTKLKSVLADLAIEIFMSLGPALRDLLQGAKAFTNAAIDWFKVHNALKLINIALRTAGILIATFLSAVFLANLSSMVKGFTMMRIAIAGMNRQLTLANIQAASLTKRMKLGFGAVGAITIVGSLSWQLGRLAAELFNLDKPVRRFFQSFIHGSDQLLRELRGLEDEFLQFREMMPENVQLKYGFDSHTFASIQTLLDKASELREALEIQPKSPKLTLELMKVNEALDSYSTKWRQATAEQAAGERAFKSLQGTIAEHPKLFSEAVESTNTLAEAMDKFIDLVGEYNSGEGLELQKRTEKQSKLMAQLRGKLLDIGVAFSDATGDIAARMEDLDEIGDKFGVDVSHVDIVKAYAAEFVKIGDAVQAAGDKIDEEFAKDYVIAFEFEAFKPGGMLEGLDVPIDQLKTVWDETVTEMEGRGYDAIKQHQAAWGAVRMFAMQYAADIERANTAAEEQQSIMRDVQSAWQDIAPRNMFSKAFAGIEKDLTDKMIRGMTADEIGTAVDNQLAEIFSKNQIDFLPPEAYEAQLFALETRLQEAINQGMSTENVALAFEEEILSMVSMFMAAGEELPPSLQPLFDFIKENKIELYGEEAAEGDKRRLGETKNIILEGFQSIFRNATRDMSRLITDAIVGGTDLAASFDRLKKRMIQGMIQMTIKWIAARIKAHIMETTMTDKENMKSFGGVLAKVFGNVYSSIAAIPIVGPILAPVLAAAAFATVLHFGKKLLTGGGFAEGGYVRGPGTSRSDSLLTRVSNGEFILQAKAVNRIGVGLLERLNAGNIDLGGLTPALAGGSLGAISHAPRQSAAPTIIVQIFQTFTGDNWRENGIDEELREVIDTATREAIEDGTSQPMPTEVS